MSISIIDIRPIYDTRPDKLFTDVRKVIITPALISVFYTNRYGQERVSRFDRNKYGFIML